MLSFNQPQLRIAILDLNAGHPNQGMRCIQQILSEWTAANDIDTEVAIYDVRVKNEVPDESYDIYISSGGPGDPLSSRYDDWDIEWNKWLSSIVRYNENPSNYNKKHVFLICHSFQLACRHFNTGLVCKRRSTSFGVFPVHMMQGGREEPVFKNLKDPFYAVDSRDYQVIQPNHKKIKEMGGRILCIEKARPHIPLERALMGIRFNKYIIGTQFHPEADAAGMTIHFSNEEKRQSVIDNHGEEKLRSMLEHLEDPDKILFTYATLLPNFLNLAAEQFVMATA